MENRLHRMAPFATPWWDFWSSWNIVWTPANVEEFARAINKKLE